eukprot:1090888-Pyramimonas_sp.AAC.1
MVEGRGVGGAPASKNGLNSMLFSDSSGGEPLAAEYALVHSSMTMMEGMAGLHEWPPPSANRWRAKNALL